MIDLTGSIAEKKTPGFRKMFVVEFYDGPEKGIAYDSEGHGLRFWSVGDSKSRMFRAFVFEMIDADWQNISSTLNSDSSTIETSPDPEEMSLVSKLLDDQNVLDRFLGIGPPYMEWIAGFLASPEQIRKAEEEGFGFVHTCLKRSSD